MKVRKAITKTIYSLTNRLDLQRTDKIWFHFIIFGCRITNIVKPIFQEIFFFLSKQIFFVSHKMCAEKHKKEGKNSTKKYRWEIRILYDAHKMFLCVGKRNKMKRMYIFMVSWFMGQMPITFAFIWFPSLFVGDDNFILYTNIFFSLIHLLLFQNEFFLTWQTKEKSVIISSCWLFLLCMF